MLDRSTSLGLRLRGLDRHAHPTIIVIVDRALLRSRDGELLGSDRWTEGWSRGHGVDVEGDPVDVTWGTVAEAMRRPVEWPVRRRRVRPFIG